MSSMLESSFWTKRLILFCWLLVLVISGCAIPGSKAATIKNELKQALERFLTIENEVRISYDTSNLSSVATGQYLEDSPSFIAYYKNQDAESKGPVMHAAEEFEIEWVEVLASGPSWAVVEARKNYLSFSQDMQTGKRTYDNVRRWRDTTYLLIKETDVWKVDRILDGGSWSG